MNNKNNIMRFYRCCSYRDKINKFTIKSKKTTALTPEEALGEMISHELDASSGRGIFYSMGTRLEEIEDYSTRNPQNNEIRYVDIDVKNIPQEVIGIYPIFNRDIVLNLIATSDTVLENNYVTNPDTGRRYTLMGIVNYSQRAVCGWANSLHECMFQVNNLKLKSLREIEEEITAEQTESLLERLYIKKVKEENKRKLRMNFNETFESFPLKRRFIISQVESNSWYV